MKRMVQGILCIIWLSLTGCATQTSMREEFDRSVKGYNRMLRWHELENAGMTYIDPELRGEYLKQADILKRRGLSVTDYRILSTLCVPEKKTGEAIAEFDYYMLPSNRVKTISYRQEWAYQEETKNWKLKSGLSPFE